MSDLFKKALYFGIGFTIASKEKVEQYVEDLVKRGELAPSESKEMIDKLINKGEEEKSEIKKIIKNQVNEILHELRIPQMEYVKSLEERIEKLENQQE